MSPQERSDRKRRRAVKLDNPRILPRREEESVLAQSAQPFTQRAGLMDGATAKREYTRIVDELQVKRQAKDADVLE